MPYYNCVHLFSYLPMKILNHRETIRARIVGQYTTINVILIFCEEHWSCCSVAGHLPNQFYKYIHITVMIITFTSQKSTVHNFNLPLVCGSYRIAVVAKSMTSHPVSLMQYYFRAFPLHYYRAFLAKLTYVY